ncbi:hypothetical protein L9W73_08555 [Vibrio aestuarianus]|uniref:Uncharacterized protein n=1 Tax=Vibrio aestuarianus TaxID=28171 RepID=A0A9X4J406_9VIBR|nr:hypothetical protein [Vibrio aestuarianus]MDE1357351.1 hypothetical protein [Vibrio aestuarianus]
MESVIKYCHDRKYNLDNITLNRVQACIDKYCNELVETYLNDVLDSKNKESKFIVKHDILGDIVMLDVSFEFSPNQLELISTTLLSSSIDINEVHLKYFTLELIDEIMSGQINGELKKHTIRTYNKIFNSHPIRNEVLINDSDYRFLIKPLEWTSKEEPMTEQIVMLDIEVEAVNIEHARSLAFNHTLNVNSYLSVLLDVGFDMVSSEFRIFTTKHGNEFNLNRYRTGFIDYELGLIVKDNHYGLKSVLDLEHVNSFQSGKVAMNFAMPKSDGGYEFLGSTIYDTTSNNEFLDDVFSAHKIKQKKSKHKPQYFPISSEPHYPDNEISIPTDIRKYFSGISKLGSNYRAAFNSCCRMYNISITSGGNLATLDKSYKVCAIEALSKVEGISFSQFLEKYSIEGFDKKLSDYFYTVRSSHFHAGKFAFDEFNFNMQREISFSFKEKTSDYINFDNYIRIAIVNWIKSNILEK